MSRGRKRQPEEVTSATDFVHKAADLTDHESVTAIRLIHKVQTKWAGKPNTEKNLDQMRDEMLTQLADVGILASFDPTPCFYGDPPEIEILGKLSSDPIHKYGFDHEQKEFEVREAAKRGEEYRGQKER
jgi:hypothetical protein